MIRLEIGVRPSEPNLSFSCYIQILTVMRSLDIEYWFVLVWTRKDKNQIDFLIKGISMSS